MSSVLEQQLLVITGKGGVGKTTVAAAIGVLAASRGLRTIVVELGAHSLVSELFGVAEAEPGAETQLDERLSGISIDPDTALLEWLQALGGRVSGRVLATSSTFQYFSLAAPGAKEMISMMKIWELTQRERWRKRTASYDLVVLDAPATGHALGLLESPKTLAAIARVGPIVGQAQRVRDLLEDPQRTSYLAIAQATEMAVSETIELQEKLRARMGRELHAVVVNGLLPQRFTAAELRRLDSLDGDVEVTHSAVRAAHAMHTRARFQQNQLARLRRRSFEVLSVAFQFGALDLAGVRRVAEQLGRKL